MSSPIDKLGDKGRPAGAWGSGKPKLKKLPSLQEIGKFVREREGESPIAERATSIANMPPPFSASVSASVSASASIPPPPPNQSPFSRKPTLHRLLTTDNALQPAPTKSLTNSRNLANTPHPEAEKLMKAISVYAESPVDSLGDEKGPGMTPGGGRLKLPMSAVTRASALPWSGETPTERTPISKADVWNRLKGAQNEEQRQREGQIGALDGRRDRDWGKMDSVRTPTAEWRSDSLAGYRSHGGRSQTDGGRLVNPNSKMHVDTNRLAATPLSMDGPSPLSGVGTLSTAESMSVITPQESVRSPTSSGDQSKGNGQRRGSVDYKKSDGRPTSWTADPDSFTPTTAYPKGRGDVPGEGYVKGYKGIPSVKEPANNRNEGGGRGGKRWVEGRGFKPEGGKRKDTDMKSPRLASGGTEHYRQSSNVSGSMSPGSDGHHREASGEEAMWRKGPARGLLMAAKMSPVEVVHDLNKENQRQRLSMDSKASDKGMEDKLKALSSPKENVQHNTGPTESKSTQAIASAPPPPPAAEMYPLQNKWTLYFDTGKSHSKIITASESATSAESTAPQAQYRGKHTTEADFEDRLMVLAEFGSVEAFGKVFDAGVDSKTVFPGEMALGHNLHLFKTPIRPMYEDPANEKGGRWTLVMTDKYFLDRCWQFLVCALIGEQLDDGDEFCGAVVSIRPKACRLQIWVRNKNAFEANEKIGARLLQLLEIHEWSGVQLDFQPNAGSLDPGIKYTQFGGNGVRRASANRSPRPGAAVPNPNPASAPQKMGAFRTSSSSLSRTYPTRKSFVNPFGAALGIDLSNDSRRPSMNRGNSSSKLKHELDA